MHANRIEKLLFIGPVIVLLILFSVFPLLYSLFMSFTDFSIARGYTNGFIGLDNYVQLMKNKQFLVSIFNTAKLIVFGVSTQILLGFVIAKLFKARHGSRLTTFLRTIYIIPIMVTPLIFGLISVYLFDPVYGIINYILQALDLGTMTWYGSEKTALFTIYIVDTWQWTPFTTLLILTGLLNVNESLYEASSIDGASVLQQVFHIEIPLLSRVVGIAVIMRFMDIFRMFDLIYASTKGGPGISTEVISLFAYRQSFNFYKTGFGSTAALIALILTVFFSSKLNTYLSMEN